MVLVFYWPAGTNGGGGIDFLSDGRAKRSVLQFMLHLNGLRGLKLGNMMTGNGTNDRSSDQSREKNDPTNQTLRKPNEKASKPGQKCVIKFRYLAAESFYPHARKVVNI